MNGSVFSHSGPDGGAALPVALEFPLKAFPRAQITCS